MAIQYYFYVCRADYASEWKIQKKRLDSLWVFMKKSVKPESSDNSRSEYPRYQKFGREKIHRECLKIATKLRHLFDSLNFSLRKDVWV